MRGAAALRRYAGFVGVEDTLGCVFAAGHALGQVAVVVVDGRARRALVAALLKNLSLSHRHTGAPLQEPIGPLWVREGVRDGVQLLMVQRKSCLPEEMAQLGVIETHAPQGSEPDCLDYAGFGLPRKHLGRPAALG